jgi:hypothetical protein
VSSKERLLSETIRSMYEVISFSEGEEPDWEVMKNVFSPNAHLARITPDGIDYFDLPTFQSMVQEMLDIGIYTSFYEYEVARRADCFGDLAHVLSVYETKRNPFTPGFLGRGVNSIQLLWSGESWQVLSLLWDEETEKNHLDLDRIFSTEVVHG